MKSTIFSGHQMIAETWTEFDQIKCVVVPTLSAYAIEYAEFTPPPHLDMGYQRLCHGADFSLDGDKIHFIAPFPAAIGGLESCSLFAHYHGIRDHELLFPQVTDEVLRKRLARHFEEAEIAFDSNAWLSFALMAGAVYEGLLGWCLGVRSQTFKELIDHSHNSGIISGIEASILTSARDNRNLVHPFRHTEEWVTRRRAMDMKAVMSSLIRKLSLLSKR